MKMQKIAIINLKGGVGKSVTACNLACILGQMHHRRVLVMDLDKQANTSKFFKTFDPGISTVADVMMESITLSDIIQKTDFEYVDVAPSSMSMIKANREVMLDVTRPQHNRLRKALNGIADKYDYCILDCPPDIDMATINALVAADWVIVPVDCDEWAFDGLFEIMEQVDAVRENYNPGIKVMGILATKYTRGTYSEKVLVQLDQLDKMHYPVFRAEDGSVLRIDYSVKVKEAKTEHLPIYCYRVPASTEYRQLADIVEKMVEGKKNG